MSADGNAGDLPGREAGARWISSEYAELVAMLPGGYPGAQEPAQGKSAPEPRRPDFNLLIIGSGYGGAVAASQFARPPSAKADARDPQIAEVAVLERGLEYLPGMFPSRAWEMTRRVRGSVGPRTRDGEGLFDARVGGDLAVVLANGLGGGSLINAGVMELPDAAVFERAWPSALANRTALDKFYARARKMLGAEINGEKNHIGLHARFRNGARPAKQKVLERIGKGSSKRDAAITIAMDGRPSAAGVPLAACKLCGDCATGCNYGAKESLDTNLLVQAWRRGVQIYCGGTALRIEPWVFGEKDVGWAVKTVHTDPQLRALERGPAWILTRKLILAAGALGSTELLLRSQRVSRDLSFSPQLGRRFSGNGDMLCFGYDWTGADLPDANAFSDENRKTGSNIGAGERGDIGPTICGVVEAHITPKGQATQKVLIEELAVPAPLRWFAQEMLTSANTLQDLASVDRSDHAPGHPDWEPYAVHAGKIARSSVFALIGDDGAAGTLRLRTGEASDLIDGQVEVEWPSVRRSALFDAQVREIECRRKKAKLTGRTIANPLWQFIPRSKEDLVNGARGPGLSVHPLGGCAMADDADHGVVNHLGQVFVGGKEPGSKEVFDNLVVLDGAIIPSSLSANPALTIAAVALRATEGLAQDWKRSLGPIADARKETPRPVYANSGDPARHPNLADVQKDIESRIVTQPTRAQFTERMAGQVRLGDRDYVVELSMTFEADSLQKLFTPNPENNGKLDGAVLQLPVSGEDDESVSQGGTLRIFKYADWKEITQANLTAECRELELDKSAVCRGDITGLLKIMGREGSKRWPRLGRALCAWVPQHGLPMVWRRLDGWWSGLRGCSTTPQRPLFTPGKSAWENIRTFISGLHELASHAGEVRLFEYDLTVGALVCKEKLPFALNPGAEIKGRKRITFGFPSNPWRQLMELDLEQLGEHKWPKRKGTAERGPRLKLDARYLATRATPLFRIRSQPNHVDALMDTLALGMMFLRMLLSIHDLNARLPMRPRPRRLVRLPVEAPGLPEPEIHERDVDEVEGRKISIRLARYLPASRLRRGVPVLLIHGYSAGGTTYAHPSLERSLARELFEAGREVWIVDMRTSPGLPTATHPWTFEHVALADIPAAVDLVCACSGAEKIDVVAHCMGGAMLGMAVLSADRLWEDVRSPQDRNQPDRFPAERRALARRIRRVALSQVGPVLTMSPANTFRAYVVSYFSHVFGDMPYRFRPEEGEGLQSELIDRLLSTLPYPDDELRQETAWLPWHRREYQASRHRMDALYGQTFSLENFDRPVLDHLDDFFGPLNLQTVAQVMHFALTQMITNRAGRNRFVTVGALRRSWTFPTLAVHGDQNGLADPKSLPRMKAVFGEAGVPFWDVSLPGFGHQDCLIGSRAHEVHARIRQFLDDEGMRDTPLEGPHLPAALQAKEPHLGPLLTRDTRPDAQGPSFCVGVGADPREGELRALCWVPVTKADDGRWIRDAAVGMPAGWLQRIEPGASSRWVKDDAGSWVRDTTTPMPHAPWLQRKKDNSGTDWVVAPVPDWAIAQGTQLRYMSVWLVYGPSIVAASPDRGDLPDGTPPWSALETDTARAQHFDAINIGHGSNERYPGGFPFGLRLRRSARNLGFGSGIGVLLDEASGRRRPLDLSAAFGGHDADGLHQLGACLDKLTRSAPVAKPPPLIPVDSDLCWPPSSGDGGQAGVPAPQDAAFVRAVDEALAKSFADTQESHRAALPLGILPIMPRQDGLTLALGSCNYPDGLLDQLPSSDAWQRLNQMCHETEAGKDKKRSRPDLMILTGDQIYADATAGLFDPAATDDRHNVPHKRWLGNWRVRSALRRMPVLALMDDHEIVDNWGPRSDREQRDSQLIDGLRSFLRFQRPSLRDDAERRKLPLWFHARAKGLPIFVLDTRAERGWRHSDNTATALLFDDPQWVALNEWLSDPNLDDRPRIMVSPSALIPRMRRAVDRAGETGAPSALRSDGWDGFPRRWKQVIERIAERKLRNIVFLSGDLHLGLWSTLAVGPDASKPEAMIHSIHSPGLYAPFPFAGAAPQDVVCNEVLKVGAHTVTIESKVVETQGFVRVCMAPAGDSWTLEAEFQVAGRITAAEQKPFFGKLCKRLDGNA